MTRDHVNRILDYLVTRDTHFVPTTNLIRFLELRGQDRRSVLRVMHRLYAAGVIERKGSGKYLWKIKRRDWDRTNPYKKLSGAPVLNAMEELYLTMEENRPERPTTPVPIGHQWPAQEPETTGVENIVFDSEGTSQVPALDLSGHVVRGQMSWAEIKAMKDKLEGLDAFMELMEEKFQAQKKELEEYKTLAQASVRKIKIQVNDEEPVESTEHPHPKLEDAYKLAKAGLNILLIGPAGCGKTYLARQLAGMLQRKFAFVSCSAGLSEGQLLGRLVPRESTAKEVAKRFRLLVKNGMPESAAAHACGSAGAFKYVKSELVGAYETGGVFLFDEVDAADANTLLVLNTCLANGHMAVPNRPENPYAARAKDFLAIGAANTMGTGADRLYVGRNQLDEAFLDRFRMGQIIMDYDPALELYLCPDDGLRERLQRYRKNCAKGQVRRVISSRFLEHAYKIKRHGYTDEQIDAALFGGWREDEVTKAKGTF